METFEEHPVSAKHKEGDNIALTLYFMQPSEYIEDFRECYSKVSQIANC